jgi:ABC-type polysaccharide/polyol phosphate export permease
MSIKSGISDLVESFARLDLIYILGWHDVRQRYRRSILGPFWLTLSMAVLISSIGIVFGNIFKTPLRFFLPYLTAGMILWVYIFSVITEGCTAFIVNEAIIRQIKLPLFTNILRMIWRNIVIFGHNIIIYPLVLMLVGGNIGWMSLIAIPGFILLTINLCWMSLMLGVMSCRYRDFPQMINSVFQVIFYGTPIMWVPSQIADVHYLKYLLDLNPFTHLIEIVRAPLMGQEPSLINWVFAGSMALLGWILTILFYGKYRKRIAYWL